MKKNENKNNLICNNNDTSCSNSICPKHTTER